MVAGSAATSGPGILWAKLVSPLAYALAFIPILILNFAAILGVTYLVSRVWSGWEVQAGYNLGEIVWLAGVFLTSILVFGVLFGGLGWLLLRWESVSRPRLVDHLRRCVLLYIALASLGSMLLIFLASSTPESDAPGAIFALLTFLCIANSIVLDAVLLLLKRRRSMRTDLGGTS